MGKEPRLSRIAPEAVAEQIAANSRWKTPYFLPLGSFFAHLAGVAPNWSEFLVVGHFAEPKEYESRGKQSKGGN